MVHNITCPPEGHCCVIVLNSSFNCYIEGRDLWTDVISSRNTIQIHLPISASVDHGNATSTNLIKDHFARAICTPIKFASAVASVLIIFLWLHFQVCYVSGMSVNLCRVDFLQFKFLRNTNNLENIQDAHALYETTSSNAWARVQKIYEYI